MARPLGEPTWAPQREPREQREPRVRWDSRRWIGPLVLLLIAGAAIALLGWLPGAAQEVVTGPSPATGSRASPPAQPAASEAPAGTPTAGAPDGPVASAAPSAGGGPSPSPATASPSAEPLSTESPQPAATSVPTRPPGAAPATAEEFASAGEVVVDIAFPFKPDVRYRYRDNWFSRRAGAPEHYNHLRGRRRGELVRAHDGIDVYARHGAPVVAPFAGLVIDPAERWPPWNRARYGVTVVIVSQEPLSEGYAALLSHLDQAFVEPGDVVRRGEVIGLNGDSGNAEDTPPHVHFELRAPFLLEWIEAGEPRLVDAFNPYPSLRAADPDATD